MVNDVGSAVLGVNASVAVGYVVPDYLVLGGFSHVYACSSVCVYVNSLKKVLNRLPAQMNPDFISSYDVSAYRVDGRCVKIDAEQAFREPVIDDR